jgi:hypothetical protein
MLQPKDLFEGIPPEIVPNLVRVPNDKFWVFPIQKYSEIVKKQIDKSRKIPTNSKSYLKALVDFANDKIDEKTLKSVYEYSNKEIPEKKIVTDFGEILGPFFAIKFLKTRKVFDVVFPTRQNYEVFDFFIKNEHHYGFSSKALTGGSNTLAPKLVMERLQKMKNNSEFRNYEKEINVIENLTNYSMYEGVVIAFGDLISENFSAKGFKITPTELRKMFSGVNFKQDSLKIEKNKESKITDLNLSNVAAYSNFLNKFIVDSTQISNVEKQNFQTGKKSYTSTNVVYGMIKFIASSNFDFDYIMRHAFQDLNIVKMNIKGGVPTFVMQSTVDAENTVTNDNYVFRSKAAFDRVKDKLGIQL